MKHTLASLTLFSCLSVLSACDFAPLDQEAYGSHSDPERFMDLSSEVVNLSLTSKNALVKLSNAVAKDAPARAELQCSLKDTRCAQAKEIFEQRAVPIKISGSGNSVKLMYDRVVVRDCDNRYINNSNNPRMLNYSSFGCSVSGNTLQMVSDKREFTNPHLLDFRDGEKAAQNYVNYQIPPKEVKEDAKWATGSSAQ